MAAAISGPVRALTPSNKVRVALALASSEGVEQSDGVSAECAGRNAVNVKVATVAAP